MMQSVPNDKSKAFIVKEGRFEGPYFKILELVENHKLSISEISLSKITDEYIEYVKSLEDKNIYDMSEFILVASTLMLIKAKSLIPKFTYNDEEEMQVDNLEKKLELFREMKLAMNNISAIYYSSPLTSRERTKYEVEVNFESYELKMYNLKNIHSVALLTLAKLPNYERLRNVAVRQNIKIEHVIESLMQRISNSFTSLKSMATKLTNGEKKEDVKKNIIVTFLALLELLKSGRVVAEENDGDINVRSIDRDI